MWGKILAGMGLGLLLYSFMQIVAKWQYRDVIEKTIWFVIITVGGGYCLDALLQ